MSLKKQIFILPGSRKVKQINIMSNVEGQCLKSEEVSAQTSLFLYKWLSGTNCVLPELLEAECVTLWTEKQQAQCSAPVSQPK